MAQRDTTPAIAIIGQSVGSMTGRNVHLPHSYGGAVITGAAHADNVVELVYIAAFTLFSNKTDRLPPVDQGGGM